MFDVRRVRCATASAKSVLFAIAANSDPSGVCWLERDDIADMACVSSGTLSTALKDMEKSGIIAKAKSGRSVGWRIMTTSTVEVTTSNIEVMPKGTTSTVEVTTSNIEVMPKGTTSTVEATTSTVEVKTSTVEVKTSTVEVAPHLIKRERLISFWKASGLPNGFQEKQWDSLTTSLSVIPEHDLPRFLGWCCGKGMTEPARIVAAARNWRPAPPPAPTAPVAPVTAPQRHPDVPDQLPAWAYGRPKTNPVGATQ